MSAPIGLNQVAMPAAAAASSASGATFPLSGYGVKGASFDPSSGFAISQIANNQIFNQRVYFPTMPVTNLYVAVRDAGTWDGVTTGSGLAIYTDAGVLVDHTTGTDAMFTGNGWVGGALSGGASSAIGAGNFGYISVLQRGMTAVPNLPFLTAAADGGNLQWYDIGVPGSGQSNRRGFYTGANSAFPASFNPTSAGTATSFELLVVYN